MKYIDAEKLIAEIERRIESWTIRGKHSPAGQGRDTCDSRVTELSDLLSFVTSNQQEQPEVDIEKEIEEHAIYMPHGEFATDNEIQEDMEWAKEEFHYFYGLGLNARKEK
jgi:hypothetical protein